MNVIVIMNDSLRRDHIGAYGVPAPFDRPGHAGEPFIDTPNLDALAAESALFEQCYIASYPTVPNRRDLFTGRWGFNETGWEPLRPEDVLLAEVLGQEGVVTQLFFDTLPMGGAGYSFERGFTGWEWVRGQHGDAYVTAPWPIQIPCQLHKLRAAPKRMQQVLRNSYARHYERDYMAPHTFSRACDWLEDNYTHPGFMLWIDTWDPHEPFDPPPYDYARYADPAYDGEAITYPQYGRTDYLSAAELNDIRARYAGEVRMVDRGIGQLMAKVRALGLERNTLIIQITDHGYLLGEHHLLGKPGDLLGNLYEPTCHVGMFIRHPEGNAAGQRLAGLVQPPDVMPTILDFLGAPVPPTVQGRSLLPLMRGEAGSIRHLAVSGRFTYDLKPGVLDTSFQFDGMAGSRSHICARTVTKDRWCYVAAPYDMRSELYDLSSDPDQQHDLVAQHPEVARALRLEMLRFLEGLGAPEPGLAPFRTQL
jgi:arylsulfatase A-like enzyme